jgi:hypothetical protein
MKLSMQVTLDGLLRALRWRAHNMAEEISVSRVVRDRAGRKEAQRRAGAAMKDRSDDRARR